MGRSRAASLLARAGLGAALLGLVTAIPTSYLASGPPRTDDALVLQFHVLSLAVAATGVVFLFLLVRRAPSASEFGAFDLLPLAGLALGMTLAIAWLIGDDARLRPCRLGNDAACETVATQLLESAERAPTAPPTGWEERAARVLTERGCRGPESGPCAVRLYAVGSAAIRAGRFDAAKDAFLRACDMQSSWCARAAQERALEWTPAERERLEPSRREEVTPLFALQAGVEQVAQSVTYQIEG